MRFALLYQATTTALYGQLGWTYTRIAGIDKQGRTYPIALRSRVIVARTIENAAEQAESYRNPAEVFVAAVPVLQ